MAKTKAEKNTGTPASDEEPLFVAKPSSHNKLFSRGTVIGATSLLVCAALYWLRHNTVFGHPMVDDAYYLILGKALANGQPYALINTPVPGIMPIYPPVYPFLLSLLYRFAPQFPQNLWLFKLVPAISMLGVGVLCYLYFHRIRQTPIWVAYLLALFTVINPSLIFFATSTLMSECFYMLLQCAALLCAGYCVLRWQDKAEALALRWAVATGIFTSLAFLTRSIGVTLVAAILGAWLLQRMWKPLIAAGAIIALTAGPWQIYSRMHVPSLADKQMQQGYITQDYLAQFWQRAAGEADAGNITAKEIPGRIANNIAQIAGEKLGLILVSRLLLWLGPSGLGFLSVLLFLLGLLGWFACLRERIGEAELYVAASIVLIVLWPWEPTRFLLPLTPWLLYYVLRGGQAIYRWLRRNKSHEEPIFPWPMATGVLGALVLLNFVSNFEFIGTLDERGRRKAGELAEFTEIEEMMKWVSTNVAENEICATLNPALVYLYTNRKTVSAQDPLGNWEQWKTWGVRYLVLTTRYGVPERDTSGKPVRVVYQSKRVPMLRIIDLGSTSDRAPWPATL